MKLQTQIPLVKEPNNQIDYTSKVLLLGSCFSEHIGGKFNYFKFQSLINPFGIQFHPVAIESLITKAVHQKEFTKNDIFFHNEQWHCFDAHSKLSQTSDIELLDELNQQIKNTHLFLKEASHVIITLGTAWAYRHIATDTLVSNCHKVPQKKFQKELLSVHEIMQSLDAIVNKVTSVNPKIHFIFTVSPVRHTKDGFIENTRSKSHLITAIHQLFDLQPELKRLSYFPSYEVMMDELRDYRFYHEDMIHPNITAINYIWEKFVEVWVSNKTQILMKDVDSIQKGLAHKPFNPNSETHKKFLKHLNYKIETLQSKLPHILL